MLRTDAFVEMRRQYRRVFEATSGLQPQVGRLSAAAERHLDRDREVDGSAALQVRHYFLVDARAGVLPGTVRFGVAVVAGTPVERHGLADVVQPYAFVLEPEVEAIEARLAWQCRKRRGGLRRRARACRS